MTFPDACMPLVQEKTSAGIAPLSVRMLPLSLLTAEGETAWLDLEQRALDGNPFLTPDFLIPAWRQLRPDAEPLVIAVTQGKRWLACGVFESVLASRRLPLPHLRQWCCEHTFLDGLLIDAQHSEAALHSFWNFLSKAAPRWHGVSWSKLAVHTPTGAAILSSAGSGVWAGAGHDRAVLYRGGVAAEDVVRPISSRRAKSLRKGWRELEKLGPVEFRVPGLQSALTDEKLSTACTRFLELEALGWKAAAGTALACRINQESFFREFLERRAQRNRVFFSELLCGELVIGSVAHVCSGPDGFAIKLGWDPSYERGCPGYQLKARIAEQLAMEGAEPRLIDSCAEQGSFIESVWPSRRKIAPCVVATSDAGRFALQLIDRLRQFKQSFIRRDSSC